MAGLPARTAGRSAAMEWDPDRRPVLTLKARQGRSGLASPARRMAASAVTAIEPQLVILASGVYVTGSAGLQIGGRYGIAISGEELRILGPLDLDPGATAITISLGETDATGFQGRLVITAGDQMRDHHNLVFTSIAGASLEDVAAAIVAATTDPARMEQ